MADARADDLKAKREAYFDALARAATTRTKRARVNGDNVTKTARARTPRDAARDGARARGATGLKTSGLALGARDGGGWTGARATEADGDGRTRARAGGKTITGIPKPPPGDPCDLDLDAHDGRRFATVTVPRDCAPGSEMWAQIFPNGPVVRFRIPRGTKEGDVIEIAVEQWTADEVPPKPPGSGVRDGDDEEPPPPPPEEPPAWAPGYGARAPPPPPPPPPGMFPPAGAVYVPPPPPGLP